MSVVSSKRPASPALAAARTTKLPKTDPVYITRDQLQSIFDFARHPSNHTVEEAANYFLQKLETGEVLVRFVHEGIIDQEVMPIVKFRLLQSFNVPFNLSEVSVSYPNVGVEWNTIATKMTEDPLEIFLYDEFNDQFENNWFSVTALESLLESMNNGFEDFDWCEVANLIDRGDEIQFDQMCEYLRIDDEDELQQKLRDAIEQMPED